MAYASLRTTGFRNLTDAEVVTDSKDVYLIGENGQGKTNFLEALYFCSFGSSFRGARDNDLIRTGEKSCSVTGTLKDSDHDKISVKIEDGKKAVLVDRKNLEDRKSLLLVAPAIVFCHEDMDFISGPPERRRWFFDQSLSLYDPLYLDDLRRYRRILKIRNTLVKNRQIDLLDTVDSQIAVYGLELMKKRAQAVTLFSTIFSELYFSVSAVDGIGIRYLPSWKAETMDGVLTQLEQKRESDLLMGTSVSGPHRDRYHFTRFGVDFSEKASTGQRRLLALLLRVAQASRYRDVTGLHPLLLLDDVLLELDPEKRMKFLRILPDYQQAFFTFLPEEPYKRYSRGDTLVYHVKDGALEP